MHDFEFDLVFAGLFCFDLDCTERAKHYMPACTTQTIALTPTNIGFLNPKEPTTICNRQIEITASFTCDKKHQLNSPPRKKTPAKLLPQWIIHETEYSRYQEHIDLGFQVLTFGFCITLELNGRPERSSSFVQQWAQRMHKTIAERRAVHLNDLLWYPTLASTL